MRILTILLISALGLFAQAGGGFYPPGSVGNGVTSITAGTGISVNAATGSVTVTNTAPGASPAGSTNSVQRNAGGGAFGSTGINWTGDYVGSTISYAAGLSDATYGGTYTDGAVHPGAVFYAYITTVGTPDKFSWAKCIGPANCSMEMEVSITGMAQDLSDGVTIAFGATTGHLLNDEWDTVTGFTRLGNLKLSDNPGSAGGVALFSLAGELTADTSLTYSPGGSGLQINSKALSAAIPIVQGINAAAQFVPVNGTDSLVYYLQGLVSPLTATTSGAIPFAQNLLASFSATGAQVGDLYPIEVTSPLLNGGAAVQNYYALRVNDLSPSATTGTITNPYYSWFDSQGVLRVKEDATFNSVGQAIQALYNPQFTKYTAGLANYERCIPGCQWESNVAVITTENGGTGTLRNIQIDGAEVDLGTASHLVNIPAASFKFNSLTCTVVAGAIACS